MSIKTSSAKAKGRRLQNWVVKKISEIIGIPVEKDGYLEPRLMGSSGTDVILRGKAREKFPFSIECKNQETWSIPSWIKQAQDNELEGTCWLLFCKKNRCKPVIVMDAEKFFEIYKKTLKE